MSIPLTPEDLALYLKQHNIEGEVILLDVPTPTVEAAAEAVGVHPDQIVKSLLFLVEDKPVLVIANGTARIDRRLLCKHFGVSRRKTIFADPETVIELTGYPVGAVPPIGHRTPLLALVEPDILKQELVYGGGGSGSALMRLRPADILANVQAEVVSLQEERD